MKLLLVRFILFFIKPFLNFWQNALTLWR